MKGNDGKNLRFKRYKPPTRGELEITTVNAEFLKDDELKVQTLSRGFTLLDTGTHDSLSEASIYMEVLEVTTIQLNETHSTKQT